MPPIPQHIIHAVKVFWNSPTNSRQGAQALRIVADFCIQNKLHLWRLIDKVRAVKAVTEIVKDAGLAQTAIVTAQQGMAEEAAAVTGEAVVESALGEGAAETAIVGISPYALAAVVILTLIIVAMVIYAQHENARLDQMGLQQDHQRQLEKGLRSAIPGGGYKIDPYYLRARNAGA